MYHKKIGFLLFEQFTGMDVMGPLEAFTTVEGIAKGCGYQSFMIGVDKGSVRAESGMGCLVDYTLADAPKLDMLVIPGGVGCRDPHLQTRVLPWIRSLSAGGCKIISVCTGSFLFASTGLLDGKKATTHWDYTNVFKEQFPAIELVEDALFVDNGQLATSAGIASGIDLALKLIEDDFGAEVASSVARYLVVHFRRSGDQAQYSQPLRFQSKTDGRFSGLISWILDNLAEDLNIERLAERSGMSVRSFCRKFRGQTGQTPGKYVESLRLDYARQLLAEKSWPMIKISNACGYASVDVFRRAFERRFNTSPKLYRENFQSHVS